MNLADFHFIRPYWLLALLPLAALMALSLKNKLQQGSWAEVCDAELLPYLLQNKSTPQTRWLLGGLSLAAVLSILALAGPTLERLQTPAFRNDAALVIALDLSPSMNASDIKPSRLVRARYKIADILRQRKDGVTAMLVYSGDAFIVTPLTSDVATIESQLNSLSPAIMPSAGKNSAAAITLAVNLLRQAGQQQGNIFLITDGIADDMSASLIEALGSYRLSILGVGTIEGAPVQQAAGGFLKDAEGNILVPKLNPSALGSLASGGSGVYRSISTNDSDIEALMASLEKPFSNDDSSQNNGLIEQWNELGGWLLLLVLPLAALSFRKGILVFALITLIPLPQPSYAFEWNDLWQTKNQQAQRAFNEQRFEQAAEQFQSPQWKAAAQYKAGQYQQAAENLKPIETADSYYNRANALAKSGQLQEAKQAYEKSLKLKPNDEDAQYNLKLVEDALKKQQQKDDQQSGDSNEEQEQQKGDKQSQDGQPQSGESDEQADQQQEADEQDSSEQESDEAESDEQAESQQQADESEQPSEEEANAAEQAAAPSGPMDENEQANEQLLNRIKDDPAGLLKRKFKYQYGQRHQQ